MSISAAKLREISQQALNGMWEKREKEFWDELLNLGQKGNFCAKLYPIPPEYILEKLHEEGYGVQEKWIDKKRQLVLSW